MTHTPTSPNHKVHESRNIKRFREMLGIKQDALAADLGADWNQQKISLLEQKETIEPVLLAQVATALKIPVEAFRNFDEEQAIYNISCNFSDNAVNNNGVNIQHINPIDKLLQLHEEKIALYERMLKEREEMMGMLKGLLSNKQ